MKQKNDTDVKNNIENCDVNLSISETKSLSPFISRVKSDKSIDTIHSHNVSKKYKAKLMQEKEETHLEINITGMSMGYQ